MVMFWILFFLINTFIIETIWSPRIVKNNVNGDVLLFYSSNDKHRFHRKHINLTRICN